MPEWKFEERDPRYVEQELTQRDQFNNDEVTLAEAIVREVIQNSADAALGSAPVKVRFSLQEVSARDARAFRGRFSALRDHLLACGVNAWEIDEKRPRTLVIEDFATKGLTGDPGLSDGKDFYSFWRRHGKSGKTGRQGGRWGLGKLVYSTSSDIKCFFGLTIQAGNPSPLLMGQAVLANHELGSKKFVAHGFWFEGRNAEGMQMPITDPTTIDDFKRQVGITRTEESGLSIAIPFINEKITEEVIVRGVVSNYFFPILAGRLVVEVGSAIIDAKSFGVVAQGTLIGEKDNPDRYGFVEQVSARVTRDPEFIAKLPAKSLSADLFDKPQLEKMKELYGRGELLHVRMPVRLKRKNGDEKNSHVDLFIKPPPEGRKPFVLFARGSITVPGEARYFGGANAYAAFVASDEDIVSFLGDAENPAHTTWSGTAEKLNANWRNPSQTLRTLRYALWDIYTIVSEQEDRREEDALIDFFALADPTRSRGNTKGKTTGPPPNLAPKEKGFRIQKRGDGGFAIVPGPGAAGWDYPKSLRVRVAYDVLGANPFTRHSPLDFDLANKDIDVEHSNIGYRVVEPNIVELDLVSSEFLFEARGFDINRDLIIDARAKT